MKQQGSFLRVFCVGIIFSLAVFAASPAQALMIACSMEAKLCPDGTSVSRTGPRCEFALCPGETAPPSDARPLPRPTMPLPVEPAPYPGPPVMEEGGGAPGVSMGSEGSGGIVEPDSVDNVYPWDEEPQTPVSGALLPSFVVHHRSALNGQSHVLNGFVVAALLGKKACPAHTGACAQPRITLADTTSAERDTSLDVLVLLPEGDTTAYTIGQNVTVRGLVMASESGVVVQRE